MVKIMICLLSFYLLGCATTSEEEYYKDDNSIQLDLDLLMF